MHSTWRWRGWKSGRLESEMKKCAGAAVGAGFVGGYGYGRVRVKARASSQKGPVWVSMHLVQVDHPALRRMPA